MNYRVKFSSGETVELRGVNFNPEEFVAILNDQRIAFVNLAGVITHKNDIRRMIPFDVNEVPNEGAEQSS